MPNILTRQFFLLSVSFKKITVLESYAFGLPRRYSAHLLFSYSSSASKRSRARKRRETHQMPAKATTVYMIRLTRAVCPPHNHATISNLKRPMLPQFNAPMIVIIRAILSMIIVSFLLERLYRSRLFFTRQVFLLRVFSSKINIFIKPSQKFTQFCFYIYFMLKK